MQDLSSDLPKSVFIVTYCSLVLNALMVGVMRGSSRAVCTGKPAGEEINLDNVNEVVLQPLAERVLHRSSTNTHI